MSGAGSIIKLIARDENLHKANSINILKILRQNKEEGFWDLKETINNKIKDSLSEMAAQESNWVDYLFSKGSLTGLNPNNVKEYVKYLTDKTAQELGTNPIFGNSSNPFPWVSKFQGSTKSTQTANQEKENVNYVKTSKNDVEDMDFDF